ncbi:MAG: hypothetical protein LH479_13160, partial [Polaromonas sp.]|nr:hypothetical protein [Polaromonas sp.]
MNRSSRWIIGLANGAGLTLGAFAQSPAADAVPVVPAAAPAAAAASSPKDWKAPDIGKLPDDKYGQSVRQGKALMEQTYKHIGPEV